MTSFTLIVFNISQSQPQAIVRCWMHCKYFPKQITFFYSNNQSRTVKLFMVMDHLPGASLTLIFIAEEKIHGGQKLPGRLNTFRKVMYKCRQSAANGLKLPKPPTWPFFFIITHEH